MQTIPTCDNEFRVSFFRIILKKMIQCKNNIEPKDLDFNYQEVKIIEYYARDVSKEPIHEDTSHEEILENFVQFLEKLSNGEPNEWTEFKNMYHEFKKDITFEESSEFNSLILCFFD